ncbi:MAG: hypothetical protein L5655_10175 [Thermosediminibacteraceae bacterium]|nr:hypothetical protein [Thermosediminibacteraceae bacterium]
MINNIISLIAHLIIVGVSVVIVLIFIYIHETAPWILNYLKHAVIRLPLAIVLILLYVYTGVLLDTKSDKKYDFLAGSLIAVIGIGIWLFTFSITSKLSVPEEIKSEYWILFTFYYLPIALIFMFLGIPIPTSLFELITNFIPSLLIGMGLSYKRLKMQRK